MAKPERPSLEPAPKHQTSMGFLVDSNSVPGVLDQHHEANVTKYTYAILSDLPQRKQFYPGMKVLRWNSFIEILITVTEISSLVYSIAKL